MYHPNVRGRGRGGRGMSKAQSLLSRASSQLKGEQTTSGHNEDDDIGAYLSALSKRTTVQPPNRDDFSDSEDDHNFRPPMETTVSKFLKKKPAAVEQQSATVTQQSADTAKYLKKDSGTASVLGKASVYAEKYSSHATARRGEILHLSESDLDLSFSLDESIQAQVAAVKNIKAKSDTGEREKKRNESSESRVDYEERAYTAKHHRAKFIESDDDSVGVGKGGNRFLKKKKPEPSQSLQNEEQAITKKASATSSLRAPEKVSTHLTLDSEEESMQGYIQNLTDHGSTPRASTLKTPRSIKTPRSLTTMEDISEEADSTLTEAQHHRQREIGSESSDDSFKINVMDLDVLEPAVTASPARYDKKKTDPVTWKQSQSARRKTDQRQADKPSRDQSKRKKTSRKSSDSSLRKEPGDRKKPDEKQLEKKDSFFSSMCLHTVDELFGTDASRESDASEVSSTIEASEPQPYDFHATQMSRSPSPLRSILSGSSRPVTPKSSRSHVRLSLNDEITEIRSRSPSPEPISTARPSHASTVYTEDFDSESVTDRISSSVHTQSAPDSDESCSSYTSSRSSRRSSYSSRSTRSTQSTRSKTTTARSDDGYSDDFGTEGSRRSERSHSPVTESGDSRSISPVLRQRRQPKVKKRNAGIQTGVDLEAGLIYHWNVENSITVVGQQYGLGYVDPTPIATQVVSPDALETMTAFNPSTVALNDMLRQQLRLTTDFIEAQKQLHRHLLGSLAMQYHYTTLADTKKYIKQHRKPTLTFDEALRQVKEEMDLQ